LTAPRPATRRRLTRSADFDAVYRSGRSRSSRHLVLYVFPRDDADAARLGITVPRKVGDAVERNRVKRQVREAFARLGNDAARGCDVAIVVRPGLPGAIAASGFDWLLGEIRGLIEAEPG
jgi:ribonuclease P protein component